MKITIESDKDIAEINIRFADGTSTAELVEKSALSYQPEPVVGDVMPVNEQKKFDKIVPNSPTRLTTQTQINREDRPAKIDDGMKDFQV